MTQDEIVRMAWEASPDMTWYAATDDPTQVATEELEFLERFAALVAEPWIETNKALANEIIELQKQAEHEPFKMICPRCKVDRVTTQCPNRGGIGDCPMTATAQSAAHVQKQAEHEPVALVEINNGVPLAWMWNPDFVAKNKDAKTALYASPVRTKDLTDEEILKIVYKDYGHPMSSVDISRAVIAADREKNK